MRHLPGYLLTLAALAALLSQVSVPTGSVRTERVQVAQSDEYVNGYVRRDGRYVAPHHQSAPDGNPYNNYGFPGNVNPFTGKVAPGNPDTYLRNHDLSTKEPYHTWTGYQSR